MYSHQKSNPKFKQSSSAWDPQDHYRTSYSQAYQNLSPQQSQIRIQTSKEEVLVAKKLLYYMEAAYLRVIESVNDVLESQNASTKTSKDLEIDLLRLNLLIDNAKVQFESVEKKFPKAFLNQFNETLDQMRQDMAKFYEKISPDKVKILKPCFKRLDLLLNLKLKELTVTEKVTNMDPRKVSLLFQEMQKRYHQQEEDFKKFEENLNVIVPTFNSTRFSKETFDIK